mmetsp:Transcript_31106/g.64679  ORF Transcript_31106/g.64679 Transcript_31106/m.64679 type:complete len:117 (-) Transcript_31106:1403-1753(-)
MIIISMPRTPYPKTAKLPPQMFKIRCGLLHLDKIPFQFFVMSILMRFNVDIVPSLSGKEPRQPSPKPTKTSGASLETATTGPIPLTTMVADVHHDQGNHFTTCQKWKWKRQHHSRT